MHFVCQQNWYNLHNLLSIFYIFYIRDVQVLSGIFIQQNKYGRSIFLAIYYLLNGDEKALSLIKIITLSIFAISYIAIVLKLFFEICDILKEEKFELSLYKFKTDNKSKY